MAHHKLIRFLFTLSVLASSLSACGDDDSDSSDGAAGTPVCIDECEILDECGFLDSGDFDADACRDFCEEDLAFGYEMSTLCGDAVLDLHECNATLTCEELGLAIDETCPDEFAEAWVACM